MKRRWTLEEEASLRGAWKTESVATIAERLGRTVHAVEERSRLLGLHILKRKYVGRGSSSDAEYRPAPPASPIVDDRGG